MPEREKLQHAQHPVPSLRRLARLMKPFRWQLFVCLLFALLANAAFLASPVIVSVIIDDFLKAGVEQHGLYSLVGFGVLYLCVEVGGAVFGLLQTRRIAAVSQTILHTLRLRVFDKILHLRVSDIDENGTGRLITRATNDVETVNEFYSDIFINLFKDAILLLGIAIVMVVIDPVLAAWSLVGVPVICLITFSLKKVLKRNFRLVKSITGEMNGFMAENITGMRLVKAYNRREEKHREFNEINHRYYRGTITQILLNALLRPSMEIINNLVIALLLVAAFGRISDGLLGVGVLYAFTTYVKRFFEPIDDLAEKYTNVQSAFVSVDRIYELLDNPEREDPDAGTHGGPVYGDVEFRNVSFSYDGKTPVLQGISFHLTPGCHAALVGSTGAGKTTIVNLLCRYYLPTEGQILVDGVDIRDWRLRDLRRGISSVMQQVFLFDGDVRGNLDMHSGASEEELLRALALSGSGEFLDELGGLQARVYEQGVNFSTGQRQMLSFSRATVGNPGVLILDEATANIDSVTEERLQTAIRSVSAGRTCVFIAHRLSTVRECDLILLLDSGVIAERGTHEELLRLGGRYAAMIRAAKNAPENNTAGNVSENTEGA